MRLTRNGHWLWLTLATLLAPALSAQWLKYPTTRVPRSAGGRPDLTAAAPRTAAGKPDFSGMWQPADPLPCNDVDRLCTDLPITRQFSNLAYGLKDPLSYSEWAIDAMKRRAGTDPYTHCITPGGPRMHLLPTMKKIVETPQLLVIIDEYNASYRQIFTDGRPMPVDPQPSWVGYSTAKWEGDTLVVETAGFRDGIWLDTAGDPITDAATVTERIRRPNYGHLEVEVTVNDPKAYASPWTIKLNQVLQFDTDLLDYICLENEKDLTHFVVK